MSKKNWVRKHNLAKNNIEQVERWKEKLCERESLRGWNGIHCQITNSWGQGEMDCRRAACQQPWNRGSNIRWQLARCPDTVQTGWIVTLKQKQLCWLRLKYIKGDNPIVVVEWWKAPDCELRSKVVGPILSNFSTRDCKRINKTQSVRVIVININCILPWRISYKHVNCILTSDESVLHKIIIISKKELIALFQIDYSNT